MSISEIKKSLYGDACIDDGYGEYIIYRADPSKELGQTITEQCWQMFEQCCGWWTQGTGSGKKQDPPIDRNTYEQCYQVLIRAKQLPGAIDRQEFLKREIAQIDPTLRAYFIPRTLYELCFIEKCFKELWRKGVFCENSQTNRVDHRESKCWHGACFKDFGDDQDPIIINLSYRLNKSIARNIKPKFGGALHFEQIIAIADEKLVFLNSCHESTKSNMTSTLRTFRCMAEGEIAFNMITEKNCSYCHPIGIATEEMKQLVLSAIALECSNVARGKLILYRGAKIDNDRPLEYDEHGKVSFVQALSFGTGLFAGGMLDPDAAAFHYMRKTGNDAIAILVPQEEEALSVFAIPKTHALCQIFGRGEYWHARSRVPTTDVDPEVEVGCKDTLFCSMGKVGDIPSRFQLTVTPKQFEEIFQHYQKNCVVNLKM